MSAVDQPTAGKTKAILRRIVGACLLATALLSSGLPGQAVAGGVPEGVWLIGATTALSTTALQIFDCNGQLCGRVAWLRNVRDPAGQIQRDKFNPDPALRQRVLCGLTVFWALRPDGEDSWAGGWFYNPDSGKTYRIAAELRSSDTFVARIYLGLPLFGETQILRRIPRLSSEGWCN
jgi:uncharacterized protein (DUF2147 family)